MMSYLIVYQNENIRIYEYSDKNFDILKNNGEEEQKFSENEFWEWWKNKVCYQNEAVGFVILTDKASFEVPSFINISDKIEMTADDIKKVFKPIPYGVNIISYPDGFALKSSKKSSFDDAKPLEIKERNETATLTKYYEYKTNEYK